MKSTLPEVTPHYDELPDYLTIKELQSYLRIGQNKAYALANTPGFPVFEVGNGKRFPKKLVREWLERQIESRMQPKGVRSLQRGNARLTSSR